MEMICFLLRRSQNSKITYVSPTLLHRLIKLEQLSHRKNYFIYHYLHPFCRYHWLQSIIHAQNFCRHRPSDNHACRQQKIKSGPACNKHGKRDTEFVHREYVSHFANAVHAVRVIHAVYSVHAIRAIHLVYTRRTQISHAVLAAVMPKVT